MTAVQIKKILVAVDLPPHKSSTVTEYAVTLAKTLGAEILAVYIAPALAANYGRFKVPASIKENFEKEVVGGAKKFMDEFLKKEFKDCKAQGLVISADNIADELLNQAKEGNADLIVIGTHCRGTLMERFFLGSVAEKVIKGANIPVLTVRPNTAAAE